MPAPVLVRVVSDESATRDEHIAIDDGASDPGMTADADARHENAPFDSAKTVDPDVGAQHASEYAAARHDAARRDHGVERLAAA